MPKTKKVFLLRIFAISVAYSHLGPDRPRLRLPHDSSRSPPYVSLLLPTLLFLADHLRTFGHDHLHTFRHRSFRRSFFICPWSVFRRSFSFTLGPDRPRSPSARFVSITSAPLSPLLSTLLFFALHRHKLTKFCLLTDIKQLVQRYSVSAARVKTIFLFALLLLLHRPVKTILPHAVHASQYGQRREGRMSDVIYYIYVYREIVVYREIFAYGPNSICSFWKDSFCRSFFPHSLA
jgi:hypothetical protein